ncbi:hypothetical protein CLU81_4145 [Flavobacterium sp. 9]|nr:hypothetical protein [Flavobacterium sp. 9]PIF33529.1 hypothetical protein CLU81_4145 [Flavobacterium sp. 9]
MEKKQPNQGKQPSQKGEKKTFSSDKPKPTTPRMESKPPSGPKGK